MSTSIMRSPSGQRRCVRINGLRPPDARQSAACLENGAMAFVTNDRRLRRVTELDVLLLDEVVVT
jgi:predicted nucleic acid-binding protein